MFSKYVNGLAALGISSAAATLSATLLKSALLPEQLAWLGAAGTVVAAVMIPISFVFRNLIEKGRVRWVLGVLLFLSLVALIWLRAARVVEIPIGGQTQNFLVGSTLTQMGSDAKQKCKPDSTEQLVSCAGAPDIPRIFGRSYWDAYYSYLGDYLLMLAIFVPLVSTLDLEKK
jgi:hypothetical protein